MDVIDWPLAAGKITIDDLHLSGATVSSGGIFGPGTVVHFENRVWSMSLTPPPLLSEEWREVRAVLDEARGQYGKIRVKIHTRDVPMGEVVPVWSGGTIWSGGAVWGGASLASATAFEDVPAGATKLRLSGGSHVYAMKAMPFSIGDKLYRVAKADGTGMTFNPPLRRAVRAGEVVNFTSPALVMRFTSDANAVSVMPSRLSDGMSLQMVEAL